MKLWILEPADDGCGFGAVVEADTEDEARRLVAASATETGEWSTAAIFLSPRRCVCRELVGKGRAGVVLSYFLGSD